MNQRISGKRVAILATDGFEQSELFEPKRLLEEAGAITEIISLKRGTIKGWDHTDWGVSTEATKSVNEARAEDYDALMLPGGVMNPDKLRVNARAVEFARDFFVQGKPVGAICHGPWLLAEADVLDGKRVTSWPSLKTDLRNAGASWADEEVIADGGLVTSRKPDDIPAFAAKLIEEIEEGYHAQQAQEAMPSRVEML